jgi:hypothetical protein
VSRQQGSAQHRHCHERYGQQHRPAAAEPIPDMAKDEAAEWAEQIGDCECGQRCAQRGSAVAKKYPRKHRGEVKVEGEVIPFHNSRKRCDCN